MRNFEVKSTERFGLFLLFILLFKAVVQCFSCTASARWYAVFIKKKLMITGLHSVVFARHTWQLFTYFGLYSISSCQGNKKSPPLGFVMLEYSLDICLLDIFSFINHFDVLQMRFKFLLWSTGTLCLSKIKLYYKFTIMYSSCDTHRLGETTFIIVCNHFRSYYAAVYFRINMPGIIRRCVVSLLYE